MSVKIETRVIKLKPYDSKTKKASETKKLFYSIYEQLPNVANLMVNACVAKFWNATIEDTPFLRASMEIKEIANSIGRAQIEKVVAIKEGNVAFAETSVTRINELLIEKTKKRQEAKTALFNECKSDAFLRTLKAMPPFEHIPQMVLESTYFNIVQSFLSDLEDVKSGKRSVRQYDKSHTRIHFHYEENHKPFQKASKNIYFNWTENMRFQTAFGKNKNEIKGLLEKLIEEGQPYHSYGDATLFLDAKRRSIYLELPFKVPKKEPSPHTLSKPPLHMGVDLGYSVPIYWALDDMKTSQWLGDGKKIALQRAKYDARLTHAQKFRGQVKSIRNKERNYFRYLNRKYARKLVETAEALGVTVIRLEALSFGEVRKRLAIKSIRKNERQAEARQPKVDRHYYDKLLATHANWNYADLTKYIHHYAIEKGIDVVFVNPAHTSKMCRICKEMGFREFWDRFSSLHVYTEQECRQEGCPATRRQDLATKRMRKDMFEQKRFWCNFIPPDENAAFNIATCDIENLLSWESGNRRIREQA